MSATNPPDDSMWSSLAEELEVSKPAPAADPLPDAPEADDGSDTMADIDLSSEPVAEEATEPAGDGEPGRKKRRRRRRRRKGGDQGGDQAGEEKPAAVTEAGEEDEEEADEEPFGEQGGGVVPAAAEEPPAELAREVIANWDVPSWDEIVAGLYRPGGR